MSVKDLAGVGGLAYNPTPLGFGSAIAGSVFGGKGGRKSPAIPGFSNGQYTINGEPYAEASKYIVNGDAGKYNLLIPAQNGFDRQAMVSAVGSDKKAAASIEQNFPSAWDKSQKTIYDLQRIGYGNGGPLSTGGSGGPLANQPVAVPDIEYRDKGIVNLGRYARDNGGIPAFTPAALAKALAPTPQARPAYVAPPVAYMTPQQAMAQGK